MNSKEHSKTKSKFDAATQQKKNCKGAERQMVAGKRYKGSAVLGASGDFLFTPYAEEGTGKNPWSLIDATQYATLRETNEVVQLRVTVPKSMSHNVFRSMRTIAFSILTR